MSNTNTAEADLERAAALLQRSSPQAYDGFIKALAVYNEAKMRECVMAQTAELQRAQGRAQQTQTLTNLFRDASAKVEAKSKPKTP